MYLSYYNINYALVVRGKGGKFDCWPCMWLCLSCLPCLSVRTTFFNYISQLLLWIYVVRRNGYWKADSVIAEAYYVKKFPLVCFFFFYQTSASFIWSFLFIVLGSWWIMTPYTPLLCFLWHYRLLMYYFLPVFPAVKSNLQVVPCREAISQVFLSFSLSAFSSSFAMAGEMGQRAVRISNQVLWGNDAAFLSR